MYPALLIASFVVQWFQPAASPPPGYESIEVERLNRDGPAGGRAVTISYRQAGRGEPLILLHGSPGSALNFDRLQPILAEHFHIIAPDLPGFGSSSRWVGDYSTKAHARYVLAMMDRLSIERAHVLGFSMGSAVAIHMADLAPKRVRSIIFYGGIGIQEGEGTGDYHFEHFKYAVAAAAFIALPEFVPHFGLLGPRATRVAFVRNFWDTDQRPIRGLLEQLPASIPMLILHGRGDPLVWPRVAEEHHRIVEHSELVMFDASHFMVFSQAGAQALADEIIPFVEYHRDAAAPSRRRFVDYSAGPRSNGDAPSLPVDLKLDRTANPWWKLVAIITGTFISEDLTCITVGLLVNRFELDFFLGLIGCFLGIFLGDIGLWLLGRFVGRRALRWRWLTKRLPTHQLDRLGTWLDKHAWWAVFASRFMPGTRFPLYTSAGMLGVSAWRFILWAMISDLVWTPLVVALVAAFGDEAARPFEWLFGPGWIALIAAVIAMFMIGRMSFMMLSPSGRLQFHIALSKLWRWEFWPLWVFYLPLIPVFAWLTIRYRSAVVWTAANPAITQGGVVGESKHDILTHLPPQWVADYCLIEPGDPPARAEQLLDVMGERGLTFPLILKPDAAQRGFGVKLARRESDVEPYMQRHPIPVLAQVYHPGPHEAGIFYYRLPDQPRGRVFAITDKQFPLVVGDGESTLEKLIWRHRRLRMQAPVFLARHDADRDRVVKAGDKFALAVAGNHCQGTMFKDGEHLITPQLTAAVDDILRNYEDFYFGRLDVRYSDIESFIQGRDFTIIELNGVTSEATNVYDPTWPLWRAYQTLARQWSLAWQIGDHNRRRGHKPERVFALLRSIFSYYTTRRGEAIAD